MAVAVNPASAGGAATTGTGRVGNVDVLRAVAALGVLAGHAYALGGRALPVRAEKWYDVPLLSSTSGVFLFFGISGYVISKPFVDRLVTGKPLPELIPYALRRALRIFPLYWICLTAVIVISGSGGTKAWQYPFHYSLLHNLVPGREGALFSVAWTLTLEMLFYIWVPVLAIALRRRIGSLSPERVARWIVISFVASAAFALVGDFVGGRQTGLWLSGLFPAIWLLFCPGIMLALAPHLRESRWRRWIVEMPRSRWALLAAAAMLLLAALMSSSAPLRYGVHVYQLVADASRPLYAIGFGLVLAAAINTGPWFQRHGRFVLHLGLVSYGIYLLHAVILDALVEYGRDLIPLPHGGVGPYAVHLLFVFALTVPLAMASWRWFEQPLIRLAGTLSKKWRARGEVARAPSAVP